MPIWRISWTQNNNPYHLDTTDVMEASHAAAVLRANKIQPHIRMGMTAADGYPWEHGWLT